MHFAAIWKWLALYDIGARTARPLPYAKDAPQTRLTQEVAEKSANYVQPTISDFRFGQSLKMVNSPCACSLL
jgi:hypothetical protein